jgi:hypothetical protein
MSTDHFPGTSLFVELDGTEWAIYNIGDDDEVFLLNCGIARTRVGAKWAIIRRMAPLAWSGTYEIKKTEEQEES